MQYLYIIYKDKMIQKLYGLRNPLPNISFAVRNIKILIRITKWNYLTMKNYIVQYKLQYCKHNKEENNIKE